MRKWNRHPTKLLHCIISANVVTFSSWFHAWSRVDGVAKETVSRHCVAYHSCNWIYTRCLKQNVTTRHSLHRTNVPLSGHYHAAVEEVVAGRQRAQELQTGVQSVVSLEGHWENCCWAVRRVPTSERPVATFSVGVQTSSLHGDGAISGLVRCLLTARMSHCWDF